MSKLSAELRRLFILDGCPSPEAAGESAALELVGPDGRARTMVLSVTRSADWPSVAALHQGVQVDLGLPAPLIAVVPDEGFQVWFSLAVPVPREQAEDFLGALRAAYLADSPAISRPGEHELTVALVPALHGPSDKWSAFIDPRMGEMFADGPGLDMAPGFDRQADMLAGAASMPLADFQRAIATLSAFRAAAPAVPITSIAPIAPIAPAAAGEAAAAGRCDHPWAFLLAAMNDPSLSMADRIEAAKALLPYYPMKGNTDGIA